MIQKSMKVLKKFITISVSVENAKAAQKFVETPVGTLTVSVK
jgi:hypothetical protein